MKPKETQAAGVKRYYFGNSPRAVAAFVCYIANGTEQRARELLEHELERSGFGRRDRDLATELAYGMLRRRGTLDHILGHFSRLPLRKVQPRILEILRLGAYQLLFLDKVPASAAVNEAVKIAKRVGSAGAVGFVNGCLRSLSGAITGKGGGPGSDPRAALPLGDGRSASSTAPCCPSRRGWRTTSPRPGRIRCGSSAAGWRDTARRRPGGSARPTMPSAASSCA